MTTQISVVQEVQNTLVKMQDSFEASLPKHISVDRFISVAKTALINNPALASLDRGSLYQAFTQAATDGLMPDGREAAIVPFAGKAKFMVMIAGICKKARNSGEIGTIDAQVVYEKDTYEAWTDEKGSHFKHIRARGDRGEIVLTYAYALGKDGSVYFEEVSEDQMQKIKAMSKAGDSPWKGPFSDEMRRKSALRRLGKYRLPNSTDLASVFEKDDEIYEAETVEAAASEPVKKSSRLSKIVAEQKSVPVTIQAMQASVEPAANTTVEEAVVIAKQVFKEPAKPAEAKTGNQTITGKIQDITAKDGVGANGPWRRHAVKLSDNFYGTFDTKINDQLTAALDAGQDVTIEYTEMNKNGKPFRNIVSVMPVVMQEATTYEALDESDIPI